MLYHIQQSLAPYLQNRISKGNRTDGKVNMNIHAGYSLYFPYYSTRFSPGQQLIYYPQDKRMNVYSL